MSKPTNETGLVRAIRNAILAEYPDAWVVKVHGGPFQEVGIPDLLICQAGQLFGFEVKFQHPGESYAHALNRVSAAQWAQLERIRKAGGIGDVVFTVGEALALMKENL